MYLLRKPDYAVFDDRFKSHLGHEIPLRSFYFERERSLQTVCKAALPGQKHGLSH
jgi:hypothetical protein